MRRRPPLLTMALWTGATWLLAIAVTAAIVLGIGAGTIQ